MATVRLVHRRTGSVVSVPEEKAASLAILGYVAESGEKKSPAKKSAAKPTSSKSK